MTRIATPRMCTGAEKSLSHATTRTLKALTSAWLVRNAARSESTAREEGPSVAASSVPQPKSTAATVAIYPTKFVAAVSEPHPAPPSSADL